MLKVFIIDNDFMMVELLEEFLVAHEYKVCGIAGSAAGAIKLAKLHKPNLVVLDQRLSGGGLGTEIAACLGSVSDLGILYITGDVASVMEAAVNSHACLAKPYRFDGLLRSIKIVMEMVTTETASPPFPQGFQVLQPTVAVDGT